jgi:hypothetical protein
MAGNPGSNQQRQYTTAMLHPHSVHQAQYDQHCLDTLAMLHEIMGKAEGVEQMSMLGIDPIKVQETIERMVPARLLTSRHLTCLFSTQASALRMNMELEVRRLVNETPTEQAA